MDRGNDNIIGNSIVNTTIVHHDGFDLPRALHHLQLCGREYRCGPAIGSGFRGRISIKIKQRLHFSIHRGHRERGRHDIARPRRGQ
jgi:hypothetical protein